jgi:hypothetical protein
VSLLLWESKDLIDDTRIEQQIVCELTKSFFKPDLRIDWYSGRDSIREESEDITAFTGLVRWGKKTRGNLLDEGLYS